MKKITRFLFSMKFALILLGILIIACVAGSVIPQGEAASYYMSQYSESAGGAILALGLDDVFHCTWFVVITVFLCLNLLGCNLVRFPLLFKRTREGFTPEHYLRSGNKTELFTSGAAEAVFTGCGFRKPEKGQTEDGRSYIYGVKNKAGIWGAWLCHLGMLIVIIGFGLGQMKQVQYAVYGVPGDTKPIEDTGYELTIDDFEVALREDDTVDQYTASITMKDTRTGETQSGQTSVNHPTTLFGMRCYQNSTGWAATVQIWKDDEMLQEAVLCAGEYVEVEDREGLVVVFSAFYPDYVEGEEGMPRSASSKMNNPAYLYRLYYENEILGMNVLMAKEAITVDDYMIIFVDPQSYTLIQIKRDPFTWLAAIGALIVLVGLILAFYLRTAEVFALQKEDGSWSVAGYSRKGGAEFVDRLKEKQMELEGVCETSEKPVDRAEPAEVTVVDEAENIVVDEAGTIVVDEAGTIEVDEAENIEVDAPEAAEGTGASVKGAAGDSEGGKNSHE